MLYILNCKQIGESGCSIQNDARSAATALPELCLTHLWASSVPFHTFTFTVHPAGWTVIHRFKAITITLILTMWLIMCRNLAHLTDTGNRLLALRWVAYSRDELLLHRSLLLCNTKPDVVLPPELRPRKRGRRGGICSRIRKRPFKPPLPSIILSKEQTKWISYTQALTGKGLQGHLSHRRQLGHPGQLHNN